MENEKFRVWHIPQIPMKPFFVMVSNIDEGIKILHLLEIYDTFQFENRIKPDYCNVNGLQTFNEETKQWEEYESEEGYDISDIRENR